MNDKPVFEIKDYELIDTGEGEKLERFGEYIVSRPSKISFWPKRMPAKYWSNADGVFNHKSGWKFNNRLKSDWIFSFQDTTVQLAPLNNGQIGIFPEHLTYLEKLLPKNKASKVLNLFGYTGAASLYHAQRGSSVTHVDIAKGAIDKLRANIELSNINNIRIIKEDALSFIKKETSRGNFYDLIIADPPGFSRHKSGNKWLIYDILQTLVEAFSKLLNDDGRFVLTCHQPDISSHSLANVVKTFSKDLTVDYNNNLTLRESDTKIQNKNLPVRTLPLGSLISGLKV